MEIGDVAPEVELLDQHGQIFDLDDLRGSWVLLWWYPKASTPTCTREGHAFSSALAAFAAARCEVVGISYDSIDENRSFAEAEGFEFRLLSDPSRSVSAAFGATKDPGEDDWPDMPRRISILVSPEGSVAGQWKVTDVEAHPRQVLAELARHEERSA